ncbi:MAG: acetylglutamate kinase [Bacteroidales bacterium]|nr:acetylglutamate kinase [Bacteroidales bacterium]
MKKLKIVKIGGTILDSESDLDHVLDNFSAMNGPKILVHGGGKLASELSRKLGIIPQMHQGRRITSEEDLRIVTMVYAGWINKNLVVQLQHRGCQAVGLSGADANTIVSEKRPVKETDYGWVGDVKKVNSQWISMLMEQGLAPVFSAITHDGSGHLLNTNADTIASELGAGLSSIYQTELIYIFEKKGVLSNINNDESVLEKLNWKGFEEGKNKGQFLNGMLPKLHNGFEALKRNVHSVKIGNPAVLTSDSSVCTRLILDSK